MEKTIKIYVEKVGSNPDTFQVNFVAMENKTDFPVVTNATFSVAGKSLTSGLSGFTPAIELLAGDYVVAFSKEGYIPKSMAFTIP